MKTPFWKTFVLIHFIFAVLLLSWEHAKTNAALIETVETRAGAGEGTIPRESIRLRILAHSDSVADQALKRRIRDAILESVSGWASGPQTLEEARRAVKARLPEIEALVGGLVREAGADYDYRVELAVVPFPAKVYDNVVYPAGNYEALRITLGSGLGQNWWCVLFPPLCFVDVVAAEVPSAGGEEREERDRGAGDADSGEMQVEYRFFLVDLVAGIANLVKQWLAG